MSEPAATPALPAAAVDITAYRDAAASASRRFRVVPLGLAVFGALTVLLVLILVIAGSTSGTAVPTLVALGIAGTGLLLALFVVLPLQLVGRRRRALLGALADRRARTASEVAARLASIGYAVPDSVAVRWLEADPDAIVPLVHDSVIAARLWQPAPGDERVFVEAYLRQGETISSLPVLPPLPLPAGG